MSCEQERPEDQGGRDSVTHQRADEQVVADRKHPDEQRAKTCIRKQPKTPDQGHDRHGSAKQGNVLAAFEIRERIGPLPLDACAGEPVDQGLADRGGADEGDADQAGHHLFPQLQKLGVVRADVSQKGQDYACDHHGRDRVDPPGPDEGDQAPEDWRPRRRHQRPDLTKLGRTGVIDRPGRGEIHHELDQQAGSGRAHEGGEGRRLAHQDVQTWSDTLISRQHIWPLCAACCAKRIFAQHESENDRDRSVECLRNF